MPSSGEDKNKIQETPYWAKRLKEVRKKYKISLGEITKATEVAQSTISKLENGTFLFKSFWKIIYFYFEKGINPVSFFSEETDEPLKKKNKEFEQLKIIMEFFYDKMK